MSLHIALDDELSLELVEVAVFAKLIRKYPYEREYLKVITKSVLSGISAFEAVLALGLIKFFMHCYLLIVTVCISHYVLIAL